MSGFIGYTQTPNSQGLYIKEMTNLISHRGPDKNYFYNDDQLALGVCENIVGATSKAYAENDRYVIGLDGYLTNFDELEHLYGGKSEAEVLLNGFTNKGVDLFAEIEGAFGLVVYDKETGKLYGARDHIGAKPFYYTQMNGSFLFGSEIKGFFAHPAAKKAVNADALKLYLISQYNPTLETMFKGIFKLNQGTYFVYDGQKLDLIPFFKYKYKVDEKLDYQDAVEAIKKAVPEAIERYSSHVDHFGSYLSGGVDSSYVVASVDEPINTYSVGFKIEGFDESTLAQDLSDQLGKNMIRREITADDFFSALPDIQYHNDEPHSNLSGVPLYFLAKMAVSHDKVVLSGEGADELFGGYDTYKLSKYAKAYTSTVPQGLRELIAKTSSRLPYFKGQGFLQTYAKSLAESYIGQSEIMTAEQADQLLTGDYKSSVDFQDITAPYFKEAIKQGLDPLHQKTYLDLHVWVPHDIFQKADKMTAAHGQEVRTPLLDNAIWDIAKTLPSEYMIDGNTTKKAFREAAYSVLPEAWAKRPKKGFPVPVRYWLREEKYYNQVKEMFSQEWVGQFFDQDLLLSWLEDHKAEKDNLQRPIYTVYSFLLWYDQYFIKR